MNDFILAFSFLFAYSVFLWNFYLFAGRSILSSKRTLILVKGMQHVLVASLSHFNGTLLNIISVINGSPLVLEYIAKNYFFIRLKRMVTSAPLEAW